MLTIFLAWINAKYNAEYELVFGAVVILDITVIQSVAYVLKEFIKCS